jgi:xanthine dehydrogenase accessory factor
MANVIGEIAQAVLAAMQGDGPVVTATVIRTPQRADLEPGEKMLVRADGTSIGGLGGGALESTVRELCLAAIPRHAVETVRVMPDGRAVGRHDDEASDAYEIMIEVVEPPATLLVVGGGHIGRSLAKFGAEVGFASVVLDDRPEYADPERIPEAEQVICADFEEALRDFPITQNTYIVMVTRGHKQDELSLREVVTRPAAYVGMIGSKRRTAAVLQHLESEGFPREALNRVHTPIGLDIGAETPEEIAISILAEIIMLRRGGSGHPMYYRRGARAEA